MEYWKKAKSKAEEAAKKSQMRTKEAAMKSQKLTSTLGPTTARISDIVSETGKHYEKRYMEEAELKAAEQEKADKSKEITKSIVASKPDGAEPAKTLQKASSSAEQDLDVFLLGDHGDSDEGPEDDDVGFDDDFDKICESSDDEHQKDSKQ